MSNSYKLTPEIKEFIIKQKADDFKLSCRNLVPLIEKNFSIKLSKSLIGNIIKENNLSSPIGRRREFLENDLEGVMENGGLFFLKAADIKLSLTLHFAQNLSSYFPELSIQMLQILVEGFIFGPFFANKGDLWQILGKEVSQESLDQFEHKIAQIPLADLANIVKKVDFLNYILKKMEITSSNIINFKDLQKESMFRLNRYAQNNIFPQSCRIFDFQAMQERFYSLKVKVQKNNGVLEITGFLPKGCVWLKDTLWKESFAYAVDKINGMKIFTKEGDLIRFVTLSNEGYIKEKK